MKRRSLRNLASNLAWCWNEKYLKPLSTRRTITKQKQGSTEVRLRRRKKALDKNKTKEKRVQIKKVQKNKRKADARSKNRQSKLAEKRGGGTKKVQLQGTLDGVKEGRIVKKVHFQGTCDGDKSGGAAKEVQFQRSFDGKKSGGRAEEVHFQGTFEMPKMQAKDVHLQGFESTKTEIKTIGFKKDRIDYDVEKPQTIKTIYVSKIIPPLLTNEESSDTEYLPESDNESDRLPEFPRSPSPERPPICTFIRKGPHVDKPLFNNMGHCVSKNGRMVKRPEISIPYRSEAKDADETPPKDAEPPRKKLELPPLDELPTEFYDKNGKLMYKFRKPNVAGLLLLEAGLISFPDPVKNSMANLDFPGLRNERLLNAMQRLKFTD